MAASAQEAPVVISNSTVLAHVPFYDAPAKTNTDVTSMNLVYNIFVNDRGTDLEKLGLPYMISKYNERVNPPKVIAPVEPTDEMRDKVKKMIDAFSEVDLSYLTTIQKLIHDELELRIKAKRESEPVPTGENPFGADTVPHSKGKFAQLNAMLANGAGMKITDNILTYLHSIKGQINHFTFKMIIPADISIPMLELAIRRYESDSCNVGFVRCDTAESFRDQTTGHAYYIDETENLLYLALIKPNSLMA